MTAWRNRIVGSGEEAPDQLVANPKNWRIHPKTQQDALAGALDQVGFVQPVMVNQRTGLVVDGHLRVELALSRGEPSVPVNYVDLSPEEEALVLVSLDPLSAMAGQDDEKMRQLMAEVEFESHDLEASLAALLPPDRKGLTDPDDVPEPPDEPYVKPGDLWLLGDHRLLCGDATSAEDVARLHDGAKPSLMVTDPPYGVAVAGGTHDPRDIRNYRSGGKIKNDDLTGPRLAEFLSAAFRIAASALTPGAAWYVFYAGTETSATLEAVAVLGGMKHVLVWVKPNFVFGRSDYHYRHEPIAYGWTPGAAHLWLGDRTQDSVWEEGPVTDLAKKQHPTAKPVAVYSRPMQNHTTQGDAMYEPFSGSGSGIVAAETLGRRCYAMELDPRYVQVTIERWQAFTGKEAVRDAPAQQAVA